MKLIITGAPKSGKSTVLGEILQPIKTKNGFLTEEVNQNGRRIGFTVRDSHGRTAILAQIKDPTNYRVGRFYTEPETLSKFVSNLPPIKPLDLLYIDEIGQMQLYSAGFKTLLKDYLSSPNDFIGTLSSTYSDDLIEEIRRREDILLFQIHQDNRENIKDCLKAVLQNRTTFKKLPLNTQSLVFNYARQYLNNASYVSFNKLFNNAIVYLLKGKVYIVDDHTFKVQGNAGEHIVKILPNDTWSCDCPLSQGKDRYAYRGECSHLQAVKLLIKAPSSAVGISA